jgi:AcrR family transcriptional regulator
MTPGELATRGRPRSAEADAAILGAAIDELAEHGFDELTIERVAHRAGVGKATIYRRWASKTELVVDAVGSLKAPLAEPSTGSTRDDLIELLGAGVGSDDDPRLVRVLVGLCMELQRNAEMGARYRERFVEPRRRAAYEILQRAVDRGELRADTDFDLLLDAVVGPLFYRQLVAARAMSHDDFERLVDLVLHGASAASS